MSMIYIMIYTASGKHLKIIPQVNNYRFMAQTGTCRDGRRSRFITNRPWRLKYSKFQFCRKTKRLLIMASSVNAILLAAGGLGLFMLGMLILTEGLKGLAGNHLRRWLANHTSTPTSGAIYGALTTAVIQSSSATTVMAVGFVGAGLLTFPQSLGIIFWRQYRHDHHGMDRRDWRFQARSRLYGAPPPPYRSDAEIVYAGKMVAYWLGACGLQPAIHRD